MHAPLPTALVLGVLLAGCATPPSALDPASAVGSDPGTGVRRLDGAPEAPTLAEAPRWKTGEWWRLEVHDVFTGTTSEVTKVVVGERDGRYLVGVPADEWDGVYLSLHLPGLTEVWTSNFTTEVHDAPFQPVAFPLVDGATWQTGWHQLVSANHDLTASAVVVDATTAEIDLEGSAGRMRVVYDAVARTITEFDFEGYGSYRVLDHGFGHVGPVKVAAGQDIVLLSQRIVGVLQVPGQRVGAPVETIEVGDGYGEMSVSLLAGTFIPQGTQVGAYHVEVVGPDGEVHDLTVTSADGKPGLAGYAFETTAPAGAWTVRHVAGGPGTTLVEGIAYEPILVDLT